MFPVTRVIIVLSALTFTVRVDLDIAKTLTWKGGGPRKLTSCLYFDIRNPRCEQVRQTRERMVTVVVQGGVNWS